MNGLELGRFEPKADLSEGYFGLGDWTAASISPTERFDMLNGRARIRQLPDDAAATADYWVMVVDKSTSPTERGVVKWVDPNNLPGSIDCDWIVDPNGTPLNDICTAYNGSSCLWDNTNNVGIGITTPFAKVDVIKDVTATNGSIQDFGIRLRMTTENTQNFGVHSDVVGFGQVDNFGGYFHAMNAGRCYGVWGQADGTSANWGLVGAANAIASVNFGAQVSASGGTAANFGIFASAPISPTNYAGFFAGDVFCTGAYLPSDSALKTNVEPIEDALDVIVELQPKTYNYSVDAIAAMNLPAGDQAGLLVQDVEDLLPHLVKEALYPAEYDSLGNEVTPAIPFKALNYEGLIPYLIGAVQEQNTMISQMQAQLAALQEQLAACCVAAPTDGTQMFGAPGSGASGIEVNDGQRNAREQLSIQPNPFSTSTKITYSIGTTGQVRLIVSTSSGKQLSVLQESQRTQGIYSYEWNTGDLASGVYNVMLLVDGALIVQKAVKIER